MLNKKNVRTSALALTVLSTLVAGCSGNNGTGTETQSNSPSPSSSASASVKPPEPATIRLLTDANWNPRKDWAVWKWVKEETNITVNQELQTGPESLALAIASGEMPDLMSVFPPDAQKYGPQGAFLDLSKHLDKMPNLKAFLAANPQIAQRITSPGGEMYHMLNDGGGAGIRMPLFYREDIFAKHSLQVPKTWEEMYEVSKKLKELYPDSYPFVFRHGVNTLNAFAPQFGILPGFYEDPATGKYKHGVNEPGFKKLVEMLNKFYKDGLIPPDWLSMDYKAWTQFITTNKSFISIQYLGQIEIMNSQLSNGAHLKFMPPPLGYGDKAYLQKGGYEDYGFAVSSKTKNLDAVLRYLDFIYSKKGIDILSWGKEGETYTIVDGKRKFLPSIKEPNDLRKEFGIMTPGTYGYADFEASKALSNANEQYSYTEAEKYDFPVANIKPTLTAEEKSSIQLIEEQIQKYYESSIAKFIMGETPMTQWDAFLAEMKKIGSQKLIDTYQTGLDRTKKNSVKK